MSLGGGKRQPFYGKTRREVQQKLTAAPRARGQVWGKPSRSTRLMGVRRSPGKRPGPRSPEVLIPPSARSVWNDPRMLFSLAYSLARFLAELLLVRHRSDAPNSEPRCSPSVTSSASSSARLAARAGSRLIASSSPA